MKQSNLKYSYFNFFLMSFSLVFSGCGGSGSLETDGGKITFSLASQSSSSASTASLRGEVSSAATSESDEDEDTTKILCHEEDLDGEASYKCQFTPDNYTFGLMKINLVNTDGDETTIHEAESVDEVSLSSDEEEGPSIDLSEVEDGTYSKIQTVLAYIEQKFPNDESVEEGLRGMSYRICTSSNNECGNEDAQNGDYLLEVPNVTGIVDYQFIVFSGCESSEDNEVSCESWEVQESRPDNYAANDPHFANFFGKEETESVDGYWAPFVGFSSETELSSDSEIEVTFDITGMFEWRPAGMLKASLDDEESSSPQPLFQGFLSGADSASDDQYSLLLDWAFLPALPTATVTKGEE